MPIYIRDQKRTIPPVPTIPTLDLVAMVYACVKDQKRKIDALDSGFDMSNQRPSHDVVIHMGDQPRQSVTDNSWREHWREEGSVDTAVTKTITSVTASVRSQLIPDATRDEPIIEVTEDDIKDAKLAIETINHTVMLLILAGKPPNGFLLSMYQKCELEMATLSDIGLMAYVPKTYAQFVRVEALNDLKASFRNSRSLGTRGEKVVANITIIARRILPQYESRAYEAHDDDGNLFSFFQSFHSKGEEFEQHKTYTISGKIKKSEHSDYFSGSIVNTLNYVKAINIAK